MVYVRWNYLVRLCVYVYAMRAISNLFCVVVLYGTVGLYSV